MSVPHTGSLTATIQNHTYHFDGDTWTGPVPEIVQTLQIATTFVPTTHFDIREIAEKCAQVADLPLEIQSVKYASWSLGDDLEDQSID